MSKEFSLFTAKVVTDPLPELLSRQEPRWFENGSLAMDPLRLDPDIMKLDSLKRDFGPIPVLIKADLQLAQSGYLEQYLQAVESGHSYHLTNIWLYDHPAMLNTAVAEGLTDDQWGIVKERRFPVGPWYLIMPGVFHVELPNGANGQWFVIYTLLFAALLMFVAPLVPGVRDIPRYLKLYRLIYRYPVVGELEKPASVERHGSTHGEVETVGDGQ